MLSFGYLMGQHTPPTDPISEQFYAPDLVMNHQSEIGLTDQQQKEILTAIKSAQSDFMDLNWEMKKESDVFIHLIRMEKVDEQKAIDQLDIMLSLENKIKKRQITLLISIKNTLTPEQQTTLNKLK